MSRIAKFRTTALLAPMHALSTRKDCSVITIRSCVFGKRLSARKAETYVCKIADISFTTHNPYFSADPIGSSQKQLKRPPKTCVHQSIYTCFP